jgi:outer membrane protein assembly factor BamB
MKLQRWYDTLPILLAVVGLLALSLWWRREPSRPLPLRVPGTDARPDGAGSGAGNPVLQGQRVLGLPAPAPELPGDWPQFRGPERDGMARDGVRLARQWEATGPRRLWETAVGEGYAGPVVRAGRVYLMDYLRDQQQDALRCLSLTDGGELWRYAYPMSVKRNHGMSRTVPAISSNLVVAMGPKCHVVCADALNGELRWGLDLVQDYGTTVPPWYAGQCPLIDQGKVILAPGGPEALLLASISPPAPSSGKPPPLPAGR